MFVGKYERQLDPKGRLALPSDFRPRFEPRCYLAYGQDGCIEVMTPEAFEDMANDLIERQKRGELTLAELRTKASNAFAVAVDGQGRITIDRDLRSFAGIEPGSPVVVSGAFDRVEVWHPESFERINAAGGLALKGSDYRPEGTARPARARPPDAHDLTQPQQRGGRGTNRERRTRTCSAHPQSPGRQDGQPQLRPLPSRSSGRHPDGNRRPGGCR